jgi:hypothetical protein
LYYIKNKLAGTFICDESLNLRPFVSIHEARDYINERNLNTDVYQIGFFGVTGRKFISL